MYFKAFYENFKDEFIYLRKEDDTLPDMLTCEKSNTMENDTIVRRIPGTILKRVEEQNIEYTKKNNIDIKLEKLRELFKNAHKHTYEMLKCDLDEKYWNFLLSYHIDKDIKIINNLWLFNEYYFYRYLNCAYDFENSNYDFFESEKNDAINCNKDIIEEICSCAKKLIEMYNKNPDKKIFSIFFFFSLWSNQFDLSWNPTKNKNEQHKSDEKDIKKKTLREKKFYFSTENIDKLYNSFFLENILCNDIDNIHKDITTQKRKRFDIVLDNMGVELITDFCLLYFLTNYFDEITIHVKKFPLFVSDTMTKDIHYSLNILCGDNKYPNTVFMANKWKQLIETKKWVIRDDIYWNIPLPYWIISKSLLEELKKSSFVCFKGDANYRRCLGDLNFDFSLPHKDVLNYFPLKVIALRCLKSPLGCGINKNIVEKLNKSSDDWSNYGEYAILQYYSPE
ncbi:conserved protein, unknown function [Plasmodium gallinaceum]|uniref:Sugar phosphate phosphatase n=1 Tax=Plasmodium gallinaceum TaxID=5849 RepID=A0A1J1GSA4_PLAGA|nr:conserved protein, unknown function [Plasmodium gallinaceum]CRG95387.1 conserved protein, unknown function [Plasmodium gallinaceum]